MSSHPVTLATFTPAVLMELKPGQFPHLRGIISTGQKTQFDKLDEQWYRPIKKAFAGDRLIINGYGPMEATIATSLKVISLQDKKELTQFSLGEPIPDREFFLIAIPEDGDIDAVAHSACVSYETLKTAILAGQDKQAAHGYELVIGGEAVAQGYLETDDRMKALNM